MELMEKEWAARIRKYRYGINVDKATKDKLGEFVEIIIYNCKTEDFIDNDL